MYERYFEMEQFTKDVFSYFNGKINVYRYPAELVIYLHDMESPNNATFGISSKATVFIYLGNILDAYNGMDDNITKLQIINTIIHELYHTDQFINADMYCDNYQYRGNIECAVNRMVIQYIYNHKKEIEEFFNVQYSQSYLDYNIEYFRDSYANYERVNNMKEEYLDFIGSMMCTDEVPAVREAIISAREVWINLIDENDHNIYYRLIKKEDIYTIDTTIFTICNQCLQKFKKYGVSLQSTDNGTKVIISIKFTNDTIDFGRIRVRYC